MGRMRQFYTVILKTTVKKSEFLRADNRKELIKRAKDNLKRSLTEINCRCKKIEVIDVIGEFDK